MVRRRRCRARARARIALYGEVAQRASVEAGGSGREFAQAAARLAASDGLSPGPVFAIRSGYADACLPIWLLVRPEASDEQPTAA